MKKLGKIASIAGSLLMGASLIAAAVPYTDGSADVAVIYGSRGAELTDQTAAMNLKDVAKTAIDASDKTVTSVTGGESFTLEKSSDKFYFNEALNSSYSSLDKDELKVGLADGTYDSEDIEDVDYEQSITLGSEVLSLFADNKYKNDEPTVGFWFGNNENVLSYTIDFDDGEANMSEMVGSDMPLLGNEYYVLSASANDDKIELLDSANTVVLEDGADTTVDGKVVTIDWIDTNEVILKIDGKNTKKLNEGDIEELSDGSYVAVKQILSSTRETKTQKVEFSIGSGKIILENGKEVILGEDSDDKVRNLVATVTESGGFLNAITLTWNSKDNTFLTEANPIVMPGMGVISLAYNGLDYADDSETIALNGGSETLTLEMGNYDIPLMWYNGTGYEQGEENYPLKIAVTNTTYDEAGYLNGSAIWWATDTESDNSTNLTENTLALTEDDRFVVTILDEDLSDVKTFYGQVTEIDVDDGEWTVEIEDLVGSDDLKFEGDTITDSEESNDITFELNGFKSDNETIYLEVTTANALYSTVVSEKGLVVTIPTAAEDASITFREADKDEDVNEGVIFTATVDNSTNDKLSVTLAAQDNVSKEETLSDDKYTAIVKSDLATKLSTDESGDEYDLEIEYFGKEAIADVSVIVGGQTSAEEAGAMLILDTEAGSYANANWIVVGGNCVNTVAADLLETSTTGSCLEAFEAKTGAGAGQYLLEEVTRDNGKKALIVAGYAAADTTKAANAVLGSYTLGVNPSA